MVRINCHAVKKSAPKDHRPGLADIAVDKLADLETNFYKFMQANFTDRGKSISNDKEIKAETEEALKKAIEEFKKGFAP